jgi:hypothetical protein
MVDKILSVFGEFDEVVPEKALFCYKDLYSLLEIT